MAFVLLVSMIPVCIWWIAACERDAKKRAKRWIFYASLGPFFRLAAVAVWSAAWEIGRSTGSKSPEPWLGSILVFSGPASFWFTPVLAFVIYFSLFHFLTRRLLNERWSTWGNIRLVWWRLVALGLPLLMLARALDALVEGSLLGLLWLIFAGATVRMGGGFLRLAEGMRLHEARTGETRNRGFAIARKMGVEIGHVFIVPQGKGHLTNAFASPYAIGVTDNLGKFLTRPQMDYVLAHEVAHAKKKHGRKYLSLTIGVYSLYILLIFLGRGSTNKTRALAVSVAIATPVIVLKYVSRRQEYEADKTAVEFTGDPETAIRALARLYRAGMIPANCNQFTQLFLSHPSLVRRATAIARTGHLPIERVNSILASAEV